MRNLTKTLAVVSLLASANAYPLGIGDIKLHSALNQNLNAEIALVLSAGEKISDVKVNIAPSDKFIEAGVPWSPFLSKIKFESSVQSNGSAVIKLSSREVLKEPFLGLLLEVSWPKGNLYREFTVLVDPPGVYEQATIPVSTIAENSNDDQQGNDAPQWQPAGFQHRSSEGNRYSTTAKNDTLWKIAERASRESDVSVEQMMIALYEHNPSAFYKENVNALLAGKRLKIPEREVVLKLSRKQALAEFSRQTSDWKNRPLSTPVETVTAKEETVDNQLKLLAPTEEGVAKNSDLIPSNEHLGEAKTAEGSVDQTASKAIGGTDSKVADKTGSSSTLPAGEAIQSKVAELEKQLAMMQKILTLKDQQLATLQNKPQTVEPSVQVPVVKEPQKATKDAIVTAPVVRPAPLAKQPVAKQVVQPVASAESEASDDFTLYYLVAGGVGLGGLALAGWFWQRKRLNRDSDTESHFVSPAAGDDRLDQEILSGTMIDDGVDYADSSDDENFFLSDFAPSDFDTFDIDQGEIDPVAEADVYLAYGRYEQAEELMRHAIKEHPGRDECKLKLLEIFYSSANTSAFEIYAKELADSGKKEDAVFWEKVVEMGSEICQGSTLFFPEVDETPSDNDIEPVLLREEVENKESESDSDSQDIEFDLDYFDESFNFTEEKTPEIQEKPSIPGEFLSDFNTDFFEEVEEKGDNASVDFNSQSEIPTKVEDDRGEIGLNIDDEDSDNILIEMDFSDEKSPSLGSSATDDTFDTDFDFNFDTPVTELSKSKFNIQNELGGSDLADMDEMETKLDLAIAYIDMSDTEAAKDIAREVLEKGNPEQKAVAQALLNELE